MKGRSVLSVYSCLVFFAMDSLAVGMHSDRIRCMKQIVNSRVLWVAIAVAFVGLLLRCYFELSGVLHGDALIFQTVGRGMLEGLKPYSDLFETKPPGIFLIHAVSWKLFGSQVFVKILQAVALIGIPILVVKTAVDRSQDRPSGERKIITLVSLLFGLLLSLYAANQAGRGLVESYGAAVGIWFLGRVVVNGQWSMVKYLVLGVLMLVAVGLKEPFLLSVLAGVIILTDDWRELIPKFMIPLVIAVVLGLGALLALGIAVPFFQVYLPHMLGYHVSQYNAPLYLRMFEVWRTFTNMGAYSWFFSVAVSMLWFGVGVRGWVIGHWSLVIRWLVASLLMFLSIAIGGDFYGHHFIFALPVYAALFWWMVPRVSFSGREGKVGVVFVALLMCAALLNTRFLYDYSDWKDREKEYKRVAAVVDQVMEGCGFDSYLQMVTSGGGPYAYVKAFPYGPIFVHYTRFLGASPLYQKEHIRALNETPLVFILDLENSNLSDVAEQFMGVRFSEDAPLCAGEDFAQPLPYHLLFRQG